jgi:hypothetical protein
MWHTMLQCAMKPIFLLGLALLLLASACQSLRQNDYNNWGVPETTGNGDLRWHWAPW